MATQTKPNISIADSSMLVSLFTENDAYHDHALQLARQAKQDGVTVVVPDAVIVETINILGKKLGHQLASKAAEQLLTSGGFLIAETYDCLQDALQKFQKYGNKVSMTDCIVMVTADRCKTRSILGFDQDFRDNGYTAPIPVHKP